MAFDGSVMQAQLCGAVARGARHGVVAAVASACIVAGCGGDDDGSGAPHVGEQAAWVCPEVSDIGTLPGLLYVSPTGTDGSSCGGPSGFLPISPSVLSELKMSTRSGPSAKPSSRMRMM